MANLFIGFPVPRARIADMIEGEAAPKDHHADHEDGGSDEVDCTGLEGAGGISLPLEDFYFESFFESIDGYDVSVHGSGAVDISYERLRLRTGATADSDASLLKEAGYPIIALSWDKERIIQTKVKLYSAGDNVADLYITCGDPPTDRYVGFKATGGKLYGVARANGAGETTLELMDLGAGAYSHTLALKCHFKPTECRFWVDGVDQGAITTTLPTGTIDADRILCFLVENPGSANDKYIRTSQYQFWQEA